MEMKFWQDYQKQWFEWQKKWLELCLNSFPAGKNPFSFSDNFSKALKTQKEMICSSLEIQEKTAQMIVEAQKQLWNHYFLLLDEEMESSDESIKGVSQETLAPLFEEGSISNN